METSMLKRLEATKIRLGEIDQELMDEKVTSDIRRFRELSKERANLEPVVDEYEYSFPLCHRSGALQVHLPAFRFL